MNVTGKRNNRRAIVELINLIDNNGNIVEKGMLLKSKRLFNGKIVNQEMYLTIESFILLSKTIKTFLSHKENQKTILKQLEND